MVLCLFRHGGGDQWSPDGPRADSIDTNTVGDLLVMQSACEGHYGAFAGGIIQQIRASDISVDRGAVADGVAALHVLESILGEVEVGVDIGIEGLQPLLSTSSVRMNVN